MIFIRLNQAAKTSSIRFFIRIVFLLKFKMNVFKMIDKKRKLLHCDNIHFINIKSKLPWKFVLRENKSWARKSFFINKQQQQEENPCTHSNVDLISSFFLYTWRYFFIQHLSKISEADTRCVNCLSTGQSSIMFTKLY